ncbi:unnamed protein product [Ectocarpus sp. CCAP 1310/34]|nr:unnamed protein product [Ectocarpus sp. CCAP 1310/34]
MMLPPRTPWGSIPGLLPPICDLSLPGSRSSSRR